jgi:hypothetical protein
MGRVITTMAGDMFKAVAQTVASHGCPYLIWEIEITGNTIDEACITRPQRALTPTEAVAMLAAWDAGYLATGMPECTVGVDVCRWSHEQRHWHRNEDDMREHLLETLQEAISDEDWNEDL